MNMASLNVLTTDFDCGGVDGDTQRVTRSFRGGRPSMPEASRFDFGPQSPISGRVQAEGPESGRTETLSGRCLAQPPQIEPERLPAPEADQSPAVTSCDGFGFVLEARIAVLKAVAVWFVFLSALAGIELFMR